MTTKVNPIEVALRLSQEMNTLARVHNRQPMEVLTAACENVLRDMDLLEVISFQEKEDLIQEIKEELDDAKDDTEDCHAELRAARQELQEIEVERETLYRSLAEYERLYGKL